LVGMRLFEGFEAGIGQAGGEDLNRKILLAFVLDQDGEPVNFLDEIVGDGNAADGSSIAVKKNVSAEMRTVAEDTVSGVGIADMHAEEVIALRIKPIEFVKTFRDLNVTEAALGAENSR